MTRTASRGLRVYMATVVLTAAPLVILVMLQAGAGASALLAERRLVPIVVFSVVLIAGEMWPIPVARGQEAGDEITVSSTFGFGLLLICPVAVPVLAQAAALIIDCVWRKRSVGRLVFNIAQYALAFILARAVYAVLAGQSFTPHPWVAAPSLLPSLAAAAAFLLVNNALVGIAVALSMQLRLWRVLLEDVRWQITTSAPLLGLGPLAVQAMSWTPLSIVLLLIPIVALHHSGTMAMHREQEALRDALTGLANRAMLTGATARALATSSGSTAMLLLDLDHFKDINDTLGHGVGDQMLIAVAQRLTAHAGAHDLVARLGGDEFVVLARTVVDPASVIDLAERLCAAVREPVVLNGVTLTVGCSVGIAFGPQHANTVSDLLRCADVALYAAKDTRGTHTVYDKGGDRHSATLLGLHADLRAAVNDPHDTQLWVAFQPQQDVRTGAIASVESLIRWRHPDLGNIGPDTFIPIAESTSLIDKLLDRVLDVSLTQLAAWDAAGLHLSVAVNLSARQLSDMSLPDTIAQHLQRHAIPAERLVLEVTESRLMSDPEHSAQILRRIHDLGVQISVDDFGTGYSSLSYLQRLAVDELKIDRSFIQGLHGSGNDTIVRSTIELGHNLGLRVVAEGVEHQQQADQLTKMGCDLLQGYLLGRPSPAADIPALITRHRGGPHLERAASHPAPPGVARILELVPRPPADRTPLTPPNQKAQ